MTMRRLTLLALAAAFTLTATAGARQVRDTQARATPTGAGSISGMILTDEETTWDQECQKCY
jgi:hypothetical protein